MAVAHIAKCTQSTGNPVRRVLDSALFEIKPVTHNENLIWKVIILFITGCSQLTYT